MTEYFPAKNGEYPRIYLKGYSTISNLTSTTMSLHLKVYSRWQSVLGLLQKKGHFCLLMRSYRRVLKSEHPGQQTVFFSRVANIWRYIFDDKHYSLFLARKYARIFVFGHYLFLEACSFPPASLPENCLQVETDNVHVQISVCIFALNGDYCLFYSLLLIWMSCQEQNFLPVTLVSARICSWPLKF